MYNNLGNENILMVYFVFSLLVLLTIHKTWFAIAFHLFLKPGPQIYPDYVFPLFPKKYIIPSYQENDSIGQII